MPDPAHHDAGTGTFVPNDRGSNEVGREEMEKRSVEPSSEDLAPGAKSLNENPMYQRLLGALIHEEGNQGLGLDMEKDVKPDILCIKISPNCVDRTLAPIPGTGIPSYDHFDQLQFGLQTDKMIPGAECSENQYCSLSLDERILMEINSIRIDLESGEDEVDEDKIRFYKDTFLSGVKHLAEEEKMNYYTDDDSYKLPEYTSANTVSEHILANEDKRVNMKELSLNDVGGTSSAKGKRSERVRYGNGNGKGRDVFPKIGTMNKGPRKDKARPKQKTTHLPAEVKEGFSLSLKSNEIAKDRNGNSVEVLEDPIDLSGLELPVMDDLGVWGGIVGLGDDIGKWFDAYMDDLEITMDDLSEEEGNTTMNWGLVD